MSQRGTRTFDVTCPCCQATLTVDAEVGAVVAHRPPPKTGPVSSLDQAMAAMQGAEARRDARFRQATEAEKTRGDVLARKFDAGLQRAKDDPTPPARPYDYD